MFFRSKISISKWCLAIIEWSTSTGGISATELGRKLGIKHEFAWKMLIKYESVSLKIYSSQLKDLVEAVEVDEAWFGRKKMRHPSSVNTKQQIILKVDSLVERLFILTQLNRSGVISKELFVLFTMAYQRNIVICT